MFTCEKENAHLENKNLIYKSVNLWQCVAAFEDCHHKEKHL